MAYIRKAGWVLGLSLVAISFAQQPENADEQEVQQIEQVAPALDAGQAFVDEVTPQKDVSAKQGDQPAQDAVQVPEVVQQQEQPAVQEQIPATPEPAAASTKEEQPAPAAQAQPVAPVMKPSAPTQAPAVQMPQPTKPDALQVTPPARSMPKPVTMPALPTKQQKSEPQKGPDEITGLDTVDLENPQGNWLFKRVWWERAEAKYEKIHETVSRVSEARTAFFARRTDIEKNILDPFYLNIGFSQGELQAVLADLNASLETAEKTQGSQEQEDREQEVMDKAGEEKQAIAQLQQDVEQVIKYDETLDTAIMQLSDQVTRMRNYEQQAWQDFKEIARVLDDKKARELFYKVDNAWRNVQEIQAYVEQGFSAGFDRVSEQIKQSVAQITSSIQTLKERGIDLKKRAQELAGTIEADEQSQERPGILYRVLINPIKRVVTSVVSAVQMVWDYVVFAIKWPFVQLMGATVAAQRDPEQDETGPESSIPAASSSATSEPETVGMQEESGAASTSVAFHHADQASDESDTMEELDLHELALNEANVRESFDLIGNYNDRETVIA